MATILKEAFIHKILSKLTPEQLQTLSNYANGTNLPAKTSITLQQYQTNTISEANIGITHARMTLNAGQHLILDGFLCYVDNSNCGFFAYFGDTVENMNSIKIDPVKLTYEFMDEGLDIEEFRRELNDLAGASGGNEGPARYTINGSVQQISADLLANAKVGDIFECINSTSIGEWYISSIIPNSQLYLTNIYADVMLGKCLYVWNGTSNEWEFDEITSVRFDSAVAGTKIYEHIIILSSGWTIYVYNNDSTVYSSDAFDKHLYSVLGGDQPDENQYPILELKIRDGGTFAPLAVDMSSSEMNFAYMTPIATTDVSRFRLNSLSPRDDEYSDYIISDAVKLL